MKCYCKHIYKLSKKTPENTPAHLLCPDLVFKCNFCKYVSNPLIHTPYIHLYNEYNHYDSAVNHNSALLQSLFTAN